MIPFFAHKPLLVSSSGISLVGWKFDGYTMGSSTSLTLEPLNAGTIQQDDYILAIIAAGTNANRNVVLSSTGYTEIHNDFRNDTEKTHLIVAYQKVGVTPPTTLDVTHNAASSNGIHLAVRIYRGVHGTIPMDVTAVPTGGINGDVIDPGSITPVTSGALITMAGAVASTDVGTSFTTGYLSDELDGSAGGTHRPAVHSGDIAWSSGAYDGAAWTWSGTSSGANSRSCCTLAWRPA